MRKKPNTKRETIRKPGPVNLAAIEELGSLRDIEAAHAQPVVVPVLLQGKPVKMTGRRLTPRETESVEVWLEKARPNLLPPLKEGEPLRVDLQEESYEGGYPARAARYRRIARSLALWFAFPHFRRLAEESESAVGLQPTDHSATGRVPSAQGPGVANPRHVTWNAEAIDAFIQSRRLPDDMLAALFEALTRDEVKASLGFTLGNGFLNG